MDEKFKFVKPGEVRVRIAPAPTGFLHVGTARTALSNYLLAKRYQGSFILRMEDTDVERSKPEFEKDIIESLKWLGIEWNEGPDIGGSYGPYRQSERLAIYEKYLKKLLDKGEAYFCFCSEEELEAQRQERMSRGEAPKYSGKCRDLSKEEVEKNLREKKDCVIRFKVPIKKVIFNDLIRGEIEFDSNLMGDFVIAKNLKYPLYNFAAVIDDYEMKMSHVIRGEDHISNTPKQILLQEAFGFPHPEYGHLPLILGPDRSKLSKRHGAISIREYMEQGFLPETLVNFMALLGWNPGTEREIFSMNSLIQEFSLEKIQRSGAIFNTKRLEFLNGFYIRQKSIEKLTELCLPYFIESELIKPIFKEVQYPPAYGAKEIVQTYKISATGEEISLEALKKIISVYQERVKKLSEISELTDFFFTDKLEYDKNLLQWKEITEREIAKSLDKSFKILSKIDRGEWNRENLERVLMTESEKFAEEIGKGIADRGYLLWPLRVALTGKKSSAGPFEIAEILGREKTLNRIKETRKLL